MVFILCNIFCLTIRFIVILRIGSTIEWRVFFCLNIRFNIAYSHYHSLYGILIAFFFFQLYSVMLKSCINITNVSSLMLRRALFFHVRTTDLLLLLQVVYVIFKTYYQFKSWTDYWSYSTYCLYFNLFFTTTFWLLLSLASFK